MAHAQFETLLTRGQQGPVRAHTLTADDLGGTGHMMSNWYTCAVGAPQRLWSQTTDVVAAPGGFDIVEPADRAGLPTETEIKGCASAASC